MRQPESTAIHVPGMMYKARDAPLMPAGSDILSSILPLGLFHGSSESEPVQSAPLAGDINSDSGGSQEPYGEAPDGGADLPTSDPADEERVSSNGKKTKPSRHGSIKPSHKP